jgi:hypothetical protein
MKEAMKLDLAVIQLIIDNSLVLYFISAVIMAVIDPLGLNMADSISHFHSSETVQESREVNLQSSVCDQRVTVDEGNHLPTGLLSLNHLF